jgi:hypothetical protein
MPRNPADRVVRARIHQPLHFPDLSERLTLRLSAVERYVARAHFEPWHEVLGRPDFAGLTGVFSPLTHVELWTEDVPVALDARLLVTGAGFLARTVDAAGTTRHLVRDGHYEIRRADGVVVGGARLVNTFTRYDPDPARRRVEDVVAAIGLQTLPSRVIEVPQVADLVPQGRTADASDGDAHVWHLGNTDANRHVNGMEYLRAVEGFQADVLFRAGHDLRQLWAARTRIVFRKPCFRGEGYRRLAWMCGEAPLVLAGAIVKTSDPPGAPPAAAVEITWGSTPA